MRPALAIGLGALALAACGENTPPTRTPAPEPAMKDAAELVPAQEAVSSAHLAKVDLAGLNAAEIDEVLGPGPGCRFAMTEAGPPVLVARAGEGGIRAVAKVHGRLFELKGASDGGYAALLAGPTLVADGVQITVAPVEPAETDAEGPLRRTADVRLVLAQGMSAGYRGPYTCER